MSEYHNDKTAASDPGRLSTSMEKLRRLQPELFGWRGWLVRHAWGSRTLNARQTIAMIAEHMNCGDSRAAVVAQVSPLVVAAYTDELDCVVLLSFPDELAGEYQLRVGSRLLTVNTYGKAKRIASDLQEGPNALHRWTNFFRSLRSSSLTTRPLFNTASDASPKRSGHVPPSWPGCDCA